MHGLSDKINYCIQLRFHNLGRSTAALAASACGPAVNSAGHRPRAALRNGRGGIPHQSARRRNPSWKPAGLSVRTLGADGITKIPFRFRGFDSAYAESNRLNPEVAFPEKKKRNKDNKTTNETKQNKQSKHLGGLDTQSAGFILTNSNVVKEVGRRL